MDPILTPNHIPSGYCVFLFSSLTAGRKISRAYEAGNYTSVTYLKGNKKVTENKKSGPGPFGPGPIGAQAHLGPGPFGPGPIGPGPAI